MSVSGAATAPRVGERRRPPKQLLLAFLGEFVVDAGVGPIRASALIEVLEGAGVAAPATRATLDRLEQTGLVARQRKGREILFSLTEAGGALLREASSRVRGPHPFDPQGTGWTLVTFSIPEDQRTLRHRLRLTLAWEGFASIRDGLWFAPGAVDLAASLEPLRDDLPSDSIVAFHARELPDFPIAEAVRSAWDIDAIRRAHLDFIDTWTGQAVPDAGALSVRTALVADWLSLLRADPRLPRELMGDEWPAARSAAIYHDVRDSLAEASAAQFALLVGPRGSMAVDAV